ncbi:Proline synthase co-transcribed bacterial like protein [Melipona quadrifasciata]|uniref:Proline synthase co-transcribed bacterial like protein n=1 Tax=Melipona quadrifasciata TaxID=166423 RepID=A0A0N0U7H6_9HYME|nr:Proline synthase co-transcribed bacterial like protein [Melipona quadrifasciata]
MAELIANLKVVRDKINVASARRPLEYKYFEPRLVAVSKFKPVELIVDAYKAGQRHFGENYVNELVEKGNHPSILETCTDICWHFIGHLQRNKINKLLTTPNLYIIETVDTEKIASSLNAAWSKYRTHENLKLKIMVQVNTSNEQEKSGCESTQVCSLVQHIIDNCISLEFVGLMTIGIFGYDVELGSTNVRVGTAIFGERPKKDTS